MNDQGMTNPERIKELSVLILFMIIVMLFAGEIASGTCNAAGNSQEVRVGSEVDFPPYAFVDESGQPAGFSVELIKVITNTMGLSINISTGSWDTVWNSLVSGQIDVLPIVAKLPERERLVDFSLPHTQTYDAFFVRKGDSPIPNIAAARGKAIVVMRSDAAHHELLERNFQRNLILVDTIPEGLSLISSGKHDAFLCSKLIGAIIIKKNGLTGLTAGPAIPDYKRTFSFAVKKGDTELLEKLNQGLLIVKTNGEYDRIYDKWFSFDDPWRKVQKYLLPAIIAVITIAVLAGFGLIMLQRLVRKRTEELAEKNAQLCHAYDDMEARVQERTTDLSQANQLLHVEIADRKQVEETLKLSQIMLSTIMDNMGDIVAVFDVNGIITFITPSYQRILGYGKDELLGQNAFEYIHPDDLEQVIRSFAKAMEGSETEIFRFRHQDGHYIWLEGVGRSVRKEGGSVEGIVVGCRDISERKEAEDDLHKSEERYRTILEDMEEGYFEIDLAGNFTFVNDAECRDLGYSSEELIGMNYRQYSDEATAKKLYELFYNIYNTGKPIKRFPGQFISKDGRRHFNEVSASLIRDSKEKPIGFRGISHDITERKQAEELLLESAEQYRTLVENANDIVFRVDNTGHITFVNPAALRIMGYEEKELIGRHYPTFIRSDMQEEAMNFFGRQFVKEIPNTYSEYPVIVKDGHEIWLGQNTQLLVEDARVVGFQAVARDITDRKKMEKEILALSITDQLTGLYNRRGFLSLAEQQLKLSDRNKSGMLLFFADLDLLKQINDTLGHEEGDRALIEAAKILRETFRSSDIIARLGGDEFAVLAIDIKVTTPELFTTRLHQLIDIWNNHENRKYKLSISMGWSFYNAENSCSIDDLIARADKLMYEQKQNKKDLLMKNGLHFNQ